MTTASTSTVIDQSSDAAFRTWVAEIITQLVTNCGITQTTDTGQINTSTVTRAASNTAAGFVILKFNDSLQSTSPVFIKLEFGSGSVNTNPMMWITIGTGSNGSGTLTGTTTVRATVNTGSAPTSNATAYTSYYVYNSALGYLALVFKVGSRSTNASADGAFVVFRSNNTSGAPTGDSVMVMANSNNATSTNLYGGSMQCLSYLTSSVFPTTTGVAGQNNGFTAGCINTTTGTIFGLAATLFSGNIYVIPIYHLTPVPQLSAFSCLALASEVPPGNTISTVIIGSTALTFLSVGVGPFDAQFVGFGSGTAMSFCILWQ